MEKIKYLTSGAKVDYVQKVDRGHLVQRRMYDAEFDEYYSGDYEVVQKVLDNPPEDELDERVKEREDRLKEINKKISEAQGSLETKEQEVADMLKRIKKYRPLKKVEQYLNNEITHFVQYDYYSWKIIEAKDAVSSESHRKILKMVALIDCSNKGLHWGLNQIALASFVCHQRC